MQTVKITGEARTEFGKKHTKAVRNEGRIPAVLYGAKDTLHFTTTAQEVKGLIYTPDFKVAEVQIDGKTYRSLIKDVQFHPVTEEIRHLDFQLLEEGRAVKVQVPVRFHGTSPGVKEGGKLQRAVRRVKIKTTPEKLVDELLVDVSNLTLGNSVRVRDIDLPEGVELMAQPGTPLASVQVPRALRGATAEEEEGAEGGAADGEEATEGSEG